MPIADSMLPAAKGCAALALFLTALLRHKERVRATGEKRWGTIGERERHESRSPGQPIHDQGSPMDSIQLYRPWIRAIRRDKGTAVPVTPILHEETFA